MTETQLCRNVQVIDAHQKAPESIRAFYKTYQRLDPTTLTRDRGVLDFGRDGHIGVHRLKVVDRISAQDLHTACATFGGHEASQHLKPESDALVYEILDIPGLLLIPSLVPHQTQRDLLSYLLHGCLSDNRHKTNLHAHYDIPYMALQGSKEASFFNLSPRSTEFFRPLESGIHKPVTVSTILRQKLRWITLGAQYGWTEKKYEIKDSPRFPLGLAQLLQKLFPTTRPEVAITNIYSPGDKLGVHRDVSEESANGLLSISLGCDCIFVIGLENPSEAGAKNLAVRLRSGDVLHMTGCSRGAWHGVPQIIQGTCPPWLRDWPAKTDGTASDSVDSPDEYEEWRDWMSNKRINLNVRQLHEI